LKELMLSCDITQGVIAELVGCKRPTVNLVVNREDYMPVEFVNFKTDIEKYLMARKCCTAWLRQRGMSIADIWKPLPKGEDKRHHQPLGHGVRVSKGFDKPRPLVPGDPMELRNAECGLRNDVYGFRTRRSSLRT
jgi:hypothetical protein